MKSNPGILIQTDEKGNNDAREVIKLALIF